MTAEVLTCGELGGAKPAGHATRQSMDSRCVFSQGVPSTEAKDQIKDKTVFNINELEIKEILRKGIPQFTNLANVVPFRCMYFHVITESVFLEVLIAVKAQIALLLVRFTV